MLTQSYNTAKQNIGIRTAAYKTLTSEDQFRNFKKTTYDLWKKDIV